VPTGRTTRCCSAVALILVTASGCIFRHPPSPQSRVGENSPASGERRVGQAAPFPQPARARSKPDHKPLSLFPLQPLWTIALNVQLTPGAAPAFHGVHGFFPIEPDRIVAYDLARGSQLWIVSAPAVTTPAAGGDLLFVVEPDRLAALRIADGSSAWQLPFAEPLAVPPVFDNGWLVVATINGDVLAFRASDGTLVWRRAVGSPAHAQPALAADRVYVPTEDGRVVALRVDTGDPIWEHRLGGAAADILAFDDRLFVGSRDNYFYSLKTDSGEPDWPWRTGADVIGLPIVDAHTVYFVSLDNMLWGLNRSNGNQRWKRPLPLRPTSGPVKAEQSLIVSGFAAKLPAYKMEDGTPAGEVPLTGELAAPPYVLAIPDVSGSVVIVTTRDIVKGATITALARSIEPLISPVAVLPNPVTFTPAARPPSDR
jgi:outer membrane protein assembly factor BamB